MGISFKRIRLVCLDIIKNDKGEIIQWRIYANDVLYSINRTECMSLKELYINNNVLSNHIFSLSEIDKSDKRDYETIFKENI